MTMRRTSSVSRFSVAAPRCACVSPAFRPTTLLALALVALATPFASPQAQAAAAAAQDRSARTVVVDRAASIAPREPDADAARPGEPKGERLVVEIANGSLEIVGDAGTKETAVSAEFTVEGEDAKDADRRAQTVRLFAERASDGTVVVSTMFPGKAMSKDSVKVVVRVPETADIAAKSVNGTIELRATHGNLRVTTKNGAVRVAGHAGSVEATAANGRIEVLDARGHVRATSANGAVRVVLADGNDHPFEIETKNGAVRVEVGAEFHGTVRMTTVSGALALEDGTGLARTPESSDHAMTVELGAGASASAIESNNGAVTLAVRAPTRVK